MNEDRRRLAAGIRAALALIPNNGVNSLAARVGCSPATLYRWRSGATAPGEDHLARIANLSGLDQETIRNGAQGA